MHDFSEDEIQRYSRHILLKDIGIEGQEKILNAKVLLIGAGGIGSPVALYLAAAGVGTLGIVDNDVVDLSNLQRQIAHSTPNVGRPKVDSACEAINRLNPNVRVVTYNTFVVADTITDIIKDYDFVVEGSDNFPTKFLVNDACVFLNKPYCMGSINQFEGQVFTHVPGSTCYRCMFKEPPAQGSVPTCSQAGVLGSVVGILGTIQATEALKYITGVGELLTNKLLTFNALTMNFIKMNIAPRETCEICGKTPTIKHLFDYEQATCIIDK